jgi:hypothetical protein
MYSRGIAITKRASRSRAEQPQPGYVQVEIRPLFTEDAQHVVCSLQLMEEYLSSLLYPATQPDESAQKSDDVVDAKQDLSESLLKMQRVISFIDKDSRW